MNKYAYITLLTNDSYIKGVLLLKESLRKVNSEYPLKCIVTTTGVSQSTLDILDKAKIEYFLFDRIPTPDHIYKHNLECNPERAVVWKDVLTKFNIFKLTKFDKIIFLDADLLILKNLDHCFELPHMTAALDGEYCNMWPSFPHFNAGFMVIEPSETLFDALINFTNNLNPSAIKNHNGDNYVIADQEILNLYYEDWPKHKEKHLNKYYNIFPGSLPDSCLPDILGNGYFVHFTGGKPWEVFYDEKSGITLSAFYQKVGQKVCCFELYEIAMAIIDLCYENNFNNIKWSSNDLEFCNYLQSSFFNYRVATIALHIFRDVDVAKKYIDRCLIFEPNNKAYLEFKELVEKFSLAKDLQPFLREIILKVFDSSVIDSIPSGNFIFDLDCLSNIYTDDNVNITLMYWEHIKNTVYYLAKTYGLKRFK